jgi:hypothetical protein
VSATLNISVVHPQLPDAECSVVLRVRPARGRPLELCLSLKQTEKIVLAPGEVTVDAVMSSGKTESWTMSLADGDVKSIQIDLPASPHEAMQWLSLSRDPEEPASPRPVPERSQPQYGIGPSGGRQTIEVKILARRDQGNVKVLNDLAYGEGRVLHILDGRDVDIFGQTGGSALAFLQLHQPALPDAWRISALPGPWFYSRSQREIHVALRDVEGDLLPDVQIVPANEDLAAVVGFLERGDQNALAVLRDKFVARAIQYMQDKKRDPLAAAIGLALLLRLGDLDKVQGWSQNLWQWFPALPDGAALHAGVMLRSPQDTAQWRDQFRAATLGAVKTGMPVLSDSLRYLRRALGVLDDFDDSAPVQGAQAWCDRLVRGLDVDAVFTTVTVNRAQLDWIWGAKGPGGPP